MPGNNRPEAPQQQVSTPSWMEVRKGIIDAPKPPEILAEEKRLGGKELEPIYAKGDAGGGRGGGNIVEYGAPIGYRYDNGKSEYVNFDATGKYQGTAKRQSGIDPAMLAILAMPFVGPALFEALGLTGAAGAEGLASLGAAPGISGTTAAMGGGFGAGAGAAEGLASLGAGAEGLAGTTAAMGGGFGAGTAAGAAEGLAGTGALGAGGTGLTAGGAGAAGMGGGAGLTAGGAGALGAGGTGLSALPSLSALAGAPLTEAGLGALGMEGGTGLTALASLSPIAGAPLVDAGLGALGMEGAVGTGLKALPSLSPVAGAPLVDALGAAGAASSLGKLGVSDLLNAGKLLTLGSVVGKGLSGGSGSASGTSTIPEFTANRTQLAYDVDKKGVNPNTPYRPGQGGVTYFSPTTYTPTPPKAAVEDVKAADGEQKAAGGGLMSLGGMSNLGSYSDGGRLLRGPGDGVSDSIPAIIGKKQPARLANGEFVIPARIVSELGNGSTDAGAKRLYEMMDRIQKVRRKTKNVAANTKAAKYLPA